ncbi:hypothetical protein M422DRAFT_47966 [Sphaerobolus stellatus SS14]|uniref:F-box domain-containing protein n=1 Tax=Sphaerobolus stellatus (strain SS14) TaxID=990650 RepID=A0A0C9UJ23_SPHS4|nr:hypothetical protein M422DRAFT_47966 [Sphaerobolus stellatus SS14]
MSSHLCRLPEILEIIFSYATPGTVATSSLVCKAWLEPALNELWRSIDNPLILLGLLAPHKIVETKDGLWFARMFRRRVLQADWKRFDYYARRVRRLSYLDVQQEGQDEDIRIDNSMFVEVARTRPRLAVLPNLRHLTWNSLHLGFASLFIHPGLLSLTAHIDRLFLEGEGFLDARAFVADLPSWSPDLTTLEIQASFSVAHVQGVLVDALLPLTKLKTLTLPRYWLTSHVVSSLSRLPALENFEWQYYRGEGDLQDILSFDLDIPTTGFPALRELNLEVDLHVVLNFLSHATFIEHLSTIYLRSVHMVVPSHIHDFLELCSTKCRRLRELHLELFPHSPEECTEDYTVTMETLAPVLSCSNITHFSFDYPTAVHVTEADMEQVARKLPSLVQLLLTTSPFYLCTPTLTRAVLLPFVQHCPDIVTLGFYLDGNAMVPVPGKVDQPFRKLQTLDIGVSPLDIDNSQDMALFLSYLCTLSGSSLTTTPSVCSGATWDSIFMNSLPPEKQNTLSCNGDSWSEVSRYLPMLVKLRDEERERVRHLEDELKVLRKQDLMSRLFPSVADSIDPSPMVSAPAIKLQQVQNLYHYMLLIQWFSGQRLAESSGALDDYMTRRYTYRPVLQRVSSLSVYPAGNTHENA